MFLETLEICFIKTMASDVVFIKQYFTSKLNIGKTAKKIKKQKLTINVLIKSSKLKYGEALYCYIKDLT